MKINHNIAAMRSLNELNSNNNLMSKSLDRLSSGTRINKSADNAAAWAISHKMDVQIKGLEKASKNALDGISLIQTAEGALGEVQSILSRLKELTIQLGNDTNTESDRKAMNEEITTLLAEIDRISSTAEFNKKPLLDGSLNRLTYSTDPNVTKVVNLSEGVKKGTYTFTITGEATKALVDGGGISYNPPLGQTDATAVGNLIINGSIVEIAVGDTAGDIYQKVITTTQQIGISFSVYNDDGGGNPDKTSPAPLSFGANVHMSFESFEFGGDESVQISGDPNTLLALGMTATTVLGTDVTATMDLTSDFSATTLINADGQKMNFIDINDYSLKIAITGGIGTTQSIRVYDEGPMDIQNGANMNQSMKVRIENTSTSALEIDDFGVITDRNFRKFLDKIDAASEKISSVRSQLGAYQNGLEHSVTNLETGGFNLTEAYSRMVDTDMAEEMAFYSQRNILIQANTSMLAQANQRPELVLQLLQK